MPSAREQCGTGGLAVLTFLQLNLQMRYSRVLSVLGLTMTLAGTLHAQQMSVAPSGRGTTEVVITFVDSTARAAAQPSKIRLDYGQPNLRGRALLTDSLVPYDKVWRTGANGASTLTTDVDLIIGGQAVPKGTWVVQSMPGRSGWKLLIQKTMSQSPMQAAMAYNPANDIARVDMRQTKLATSLETLTMWLIPSRAPGPPHGELVIAWGNIKLATDWSMK